MASITPSNHIQFVSADPIFGRVAEELSSFDEARLLDEGLYYGWMNDVLTKLGIGYYSEEIAIIKTENYRAKLPKNFKQFYAAYRCDRLESDYSVAGGKRGILERHHYYTDITSETDCFGKCCIPETSGLETRTSVTVEHYIDTTKFHTTFSGFQLLSLGNTACYEIADFHSINRSAVGNPNQIAFSRKGYLETSYNGYLYLFYYALPMDDKTCKPLIPNIDSVKQAITLYLQYQSLRRIWLNNYNPDVERRMMFLKAEYEDSMGTAYVEVATPSFQTVMARIRINKSRLKYLLNNVCEYGW